MPELQERTLYRQVILGGLAGIALSVLFTLLLVAGPLDRTIVYGLGILGLAASGYAILSGMRRARECREQIQQIREGIYLLHWQYRPEDLRGFVAQESNRIARSQRARGLLYGAQVLVVVIGTFLVFREPLLSLVFGLAIAWGFLIRWSIHDYFYPRQATTQDVYINAEGIYEPDLYLPFFGPSFSLSEISLLAPAQSGNPSILTFHITEAVAAERDPIYRNINHVVTAPRDIRVAIPLEHEPEARHLIDQLQSRIQRGYIASATDASPVPRDW